MVEFISEAIGAGSFLWKRQSYSGYLFLFEWALYFMSFKEFVHFIWVFEFIGVKSFIIFTYYPLNICRICSDIPSLISDIGSFIFSVLFLIHLVKTLSILLISKNLLLLSLLFLYCFPFSYFTDFCSYLSYFFLLSLV